MEWLLIPGILLALTIIAIGIQRTWCSWYDDAFWIVTVILGFGFLCTAIGCPIQYFENKTDSIEAQAYYDQFIEPNIIERGDGYVVISNPEAGIWQAGDYTLAGFNNYLTTTRHWDGVPIIGSCVYPAPDLPFVRVR